ncbi:hypothetical protein OPQ81_010707 [Rhizoctonia solani]|nr:hypothetical protein OPQ81_010707 [Rhizoctonia solani]
MLEDLLFPTFKTILQILTGNLPYAGKPDAIAVVKVVLKVSPDRPTFDAVLRNQCAKDTLWNLLLRCWEYDPNCRPTATEVKQALMRIEQEESV